MSVTTSGLQLNIRQRAVRSAVELLSSMRFAISLLVILAIASVIGTVLTQDDPYPNYVNQFGPFWADIFRSLSLYTVYSAWWFMLILGFLVVSVSLCVIRNGPKMIADLRSWKDKVREGSLRAFHHKGEFTVEGGTRAQTADTLAKLAGRLGYRFVTREADGATLIAGKRGALTKIGYIFAHLAIVVICIGGLLDSNLPIKLQMWLFDKTPIRSNAVINDIAAEHRLPVTNPTFRGYAWVPEGQYVSTAILNQPDGSLIQDLPFSIELKKFIVDYYSTGMPKLFASDIVVIDHRTGQRIPARVEVNQPFQYAGVSIYQSSFQDGGSQMQMTGWPMTGASAKSFAFGGAIGASAPLGASAPGADGQTIEFADFRAINVENISNGSGATDTRGVAHQSLKEAFDERLGSGAKTSKPLDLRNVGPSVQYKVRDKDGQAREYNNYMLPVDVGGSKMFLAGMRVNPDDPFRYLRIPADSGGTPREWMLLRAAFEDPKLRTEAAQRFAARSVPDGNSELRQHLQESASRVLALFAGADAPAGQPVDPQTAAGFQAVAGFIDKSVPKAEQEKAAGLLMRMLEGATWDLWQLARAQAGEPELTPDAQAARFVQDSINAVSDSFLYGSPVYLQLDSFRQVQASVFQLTRAPGKKVVYLGSLLLVAGIFSMFYVRERRLWFWLKDNGERGVDVLMAMSTARRTLDFEKEFVRTREAVARALGAKPAAGDAGTDRATQLHPTDSDDSNR
ncbi:cytochrome c biogenesis protein ResB [Paraburkholderia caballeronis]|uniref:Cytochrome c biogenesis protein n=1 Tax=Paraburkholderia caballeronis TaxID=416943 RepID=A0A1H7UXJ1_9BURK|nr:cytochrome c biogenesis protein ResB [Paraburkholderia caballeronis]PXW17413.1 cytochrome c biogenesis protein [Paraburkholderia caballeronis]PXW94865.1 cytochrome c biogenesis protein [Paraburkholderia caballeronis]RAJ90763.1 cytochrome c biogenesis protein [Paraburkholderia caballeronis]SEB55870.1 cytochrome c biogenesis protein [Paraburkholderia caballeronis]SEM01348.1 cytochrome c biogenesis protein [Paraburkholderia caballeronis]